MEEFIKGNNKVTYELIKKIDAEIFRYYLPTDLNFPYLFIGESMDPVIDRGLSYYYGGVLFFLIVGISFYYFSNSWSNENEEKGDITKTNLSTRRLLVIILADLIVFFVLFAIPLYRLFKLFVLGESVWSACLYYSPFRWYTFGILLNFLYFFLLIASFFYARRKKNLSNLEAFEIISLVNIEIFFLWGMAGYPITYVIFLFFETFEESDE